MRNFIGITGEMSNELQRKFLQIRALKEFCKTFRKGLRKKFLIYFFIFFYKFPQKLFFFEFIDEKKKFIN